MKEAERATIETESETPPWDISGAVSVLHASLSVRTHAHFGAGYRLALPEAGGPIPTQLELFPERLVARFHSNLVHLELHGVGWIQPTADHVELRSAEEAASTLCLIYPDGSLTLALLGREGVRHPTGR